MSDDDFDVRAYNRAAWDEQVAAGNQWTRPVNREAVAAARAGQVSVLLTQLRPVPVSWFPPMPGLDVLCLACGGGQQGPLFAAAGARVTVFDNSPAQLAQDRLVAERESLDIRVVEGDMRDLSVFPPGSFDLVFHPVSNLFVPEVRPVWREAYRVLRQGGVLLAGFMNPSSFIFDRDLEDAGELRVRHVLPYSDLSSVTPQERANFVAAGWPLEFGHSLEDQIGGQIDAGFVIEGFYEDQNPERALSRFMPVYIATRARKLAK